MGELSDYLFYGEADKEKIKNLHELTRDFKDTLLTDLALQDLLLAETPLFHATLPSPITSYAQIPSIVHNRQKTLLHLEFLELVIAQATQPHIYYASKNGLLTQQGFPAEMIEDLQRRWFKEFKTVSTLREYQKTLTSAFDEYNFQLVLGLIKGTKSLFNAFSEGKHEDKIKKNFNPKAYLALDSAYYNRAQRFFRSCTGLWKTLSDDSYGKNFVLTQEELAQTRSKL